MLLPGRPPPPWVAVSARLVRAEVMKIRTTRAWWLFACGFAALTALAALGSWASHHVQLYPPSDLTNEADALAQAAADRTPAGAAAVAASMMTSGQGLLVLVTLLLGVHVVTSEYAARTVTSTLLVTPRRELVIGAKLVTAAAFGTGFWAIATVADGVVTPVFLAVQHLPGSALGSSDVLRAVVMGLLAYVLWALFGVGLGAVLRNQVVAAVAAIAIYAGGFAVVERLGGCRNSGVPRLVAARAGGARARPGVQRDDRLRPGVPGCAPPGGSARWCWRGTRWYWPVSVSP